MTQAKAQIVIAAIVGAGLSAIVQQQRDGTWTVLVTASDFSIDSATVSNFVTSQGVIGASQQVLLS